MTNAEAWFWSAGFSPLQHSLFERVDFFWPSCLRAVKRPEGRAPGTRWCQVARPTLSAFLLSTFCSLLFP